MQPFVYGHATERKAFVLAAKLPPFLERIGEGFGVAQPRVPKEALHDVEFGKRVTTQHRIGENRRKCREVFLDKQPILWLIAVVQARFE